MRTASNKLGIAGKRLSSRSKGDADTDGESPTVNREHERAEGANAASAETKAHEGCALEIEVGKQLGRKEVQEHYQVHDKLEGSEVLKVRAGNEANEEFGGMDEVCEERAGNGASCELCDELCGREVCEKLVGNEVSEEFGQSDARKQSAGNEANLTCTEEEARANFLMKTEHELAKASCLVQDLRVENECLKRWLELEKAQRRECVKEMCSKHEEALTEICQLEKSVSTKEATLGELRQIVNVAKKQASLTSIGVVKKLLMELEAVLGSSTESSDDSVRKEMFGEDLMDVLSRCQEYAFKNNYRIQALVKKYEHKSWSL